MLRVWSIGFLGFSLQALRGPKIPGRCELQQKSFAVIEKDLALRLLGLHTAFPPSRRGVLHYVPLFNFRWMDPENPIPLNSGVYPLNYRGLDIRI